MSELSYTKSPRKMRLRSRPPPRDEDDDGGKDYYARTMEEQLRLELWTDLVVCAFDRRIKMRRGERERERGKWIPFQMQIRSAGEEGTQTVGTPSKVRNMDRLLGWLEVQTVQNR